MIYAIDLLDGYSGTGLIALAAWIVIRNFASERAAPFGAFCAALGFGVGRYSVPSDVNDPELPAAICRLLGAALALLTMLVLARRRRRTVSDG